MLLALGWLAVAQVPGFEHVVFKVAPFEVPEPSEAWKAADFANAASTLSSLDLLDRALIYLHRAAALSSTSFDHWLSFGRFLVVFASADTPYPLAEDDVLMRRLAADALGNAARGFLTPCTPTIAAEFSECTKTRTLARDVLAELVVQ
jgi:hypothetical protein